MEEQEKPKFKVGFEAELFGGQTNCEEGWTYHDGKCHPPKDSETNYDKVD